MDRNMCKKVIEYQATLVPAIFTKKQISIIKKYLNKKPLTNTEKVYLYSNIKKKMDALQPLQEEFYVTGEDMIFERVQKAKKILKELNYEKAFISGSFLYLRKYNDIDIYIISKRRKQYHKGKQHFIFITEEDLKKPIFCSAAKYSVANFSIKIEPEIKRMELDETLFTYQWIINQILEGEDQKELRDLVFQYYLQTKNIVLNSRKLYYKTKEIKNMPKDAKIKKINQITKEILLKKHSKTYTYEVISQFSRNFTKIREEYDTDNIPIFLDFAEVIKDECRRAET